MKDCFTSLAIRILIGVVAIVFVLAMAAAGLATKAFLTGATLPPNVGVAPLLTAIVASSGVLVALLAFARDREKLAREREENRSKILLEQAKAGLDEVIELLKDQNNNRVIWVRAARVLLEATALGRAIKAPEYAKAYRLYEDRIRSELYRALTVYDEETQERNPLPPQFFYGIKDWSRQISLDDAAREVSPEVRVSSVSIDSVVAEPSLKPLAAKSVVAVFEFLEYPSDYSDPLLEVEVWQGDWDSSYGPSQGARRYVAHAQATTAVGGRIHKRA
ncbi:hypothetical protein [Methylocaldum sp. 14B]|jgi:uncharacterized membrane protein|uniref:hypothetical protein n=1 Tax=Methylocaldum sp. 14B TaxID=1912213 RepID=UPI000989F490|nr:hypothetical protein [Methylocaldum sp. 14B]